MAKKKTTTRAAKGTPTRLNLWTLGQTFGTVTEIPNQLDPTAVDGIRRCLKAGLVEVSGSGRLSTLRLTVEGVRALIAEKAAR